MRGIYLSEAAHFVNALPPKNISGGATSDRFNLKQHAHASIVVQIGVSAAAATKILLNAYAASSGGVAEPIGYKLHAEETALGDTLGAKEDVTSAGKTPSANDNIFYVIEIDSAELPEGKPWLEVQITNGSGNSVIASALAILTGARYAGSADGITAI